MLKPFFSVIIPCYNSEDYIVETLESVRMQSFNDFEIVLVDDHSTDNSFEIANQYFLDHKLAGICVKKDLLAYPKGVSGARNQGIVLSTGQWICFLDSDDLFVQDKFAYFQQIILADSSIQAFHHAVLEFEDKTNKEIQRVILPELVGVHEKLPKLLSFNNICTSSVILSRDILKELNNFNTSLNGIEDFYCWLNVSKKTSWFYTLEIFTKYRVRAESLMGNKPLLHYIKQNSALLLEIKKNPYFDHQEYGILQKYLMDTVMGYYINNSVDQFGLWRTVSNFSTILKLGYIKVFFSHSFRICRNAILKILFK